jgi:hypothetical protein
VEAHWDEREMTSLAKPVWILTCLAAVLRRRSETEFMDVRPVCHADASCVRLARLSAIETDRRWTEGDDPSSRLEARQRIAASQRRHAVELAEGAEPSGCGSNPATFTRLILPKIANVSSARLGEATGLSHGYCRLVRTGKRILHARHWAALHLAWLASRA